jgi:nitrite reductase (NADH) large subunit
LNLGTPEAGSKRKPGQGMPKQKLNVIIGNSAAGLSALETLRRSDPDCEITLISGEKGPAYSLVLLPYFVAGRIDQQNLFLTDDNYYRKWRIRTIFGKIASEIEPEKRHVILSGGETIPYDRLIICTGASPAQLRIEGSDRVPAQSLRTLEDAIEIKEWFWKYKRILMIGAGLINVKLASFLRATGLEITVVELANHILANMVDERAAGMIESEISKTTVRVLKRCSVKAIMPSTRGRHIALLSNGDELETDAVIVNTGILPNTQLALSSGIRMERGILIDAFGRTNLPNVYAAGDAVSSKNRVNGKCMNLGNWFNAVEQGKIAAYSVAGRSQEYEGCVSLNITDLFGITVFSFGELNENGRNSECYIISDPQRTFYRKIVISEGRILGGVFLTESRNAGIYRSLLMKDMSERKLWPILRRREVYSLGTLMDYSRVRRGIRTYLS